MILNNRKIISTNITIALCFLVIAYIYPIFNEKIFFSNKSKEATTISSQIEKIQNVSYSKSNKYINLEKNDIQTLKTIFNINANDIKYYTYTIYTTYDSYTIVAEPKIKYLREREISPKNYYFIKKLNEEVRKYWE